MFKYINSNQLLLFTLAGVVLLIAAFSLYLLRDPSAPLPFSPQPTTSTSTPPLSQTTLPTSTSTTVPTRQTSYTPFSTILTPAALTESPPVATTSQTAVTAIPSKTLPPGGPTATQSAIRTATPTPTTTQAANTTPTPTLALGETGVTGRIVQNGTPVANVTVVFEDDGGARQSVTNAGGHYWFITLAPGTPFTLTFKRADNPQLTPSAEIADLIRVKGTLPTNANPIDLPDIELSLNLNGSMFELDSPTDGATYSASVINQSNPVQFAWTLYSPGGSYRVELGPNGSETPTWTSDPTTNSYFWWNGTLTDGTHISEGAYWWRVGVTKSLGSYEETIYTQPWDILFNP